jgi:hypothetical protein
MFSMVKLADIYGAKISLSFKGQSVFRTYIGGISSIVVLLAVLAFMIFRGNVLLNKEGTIINKNSFIKELNQQPEFNPWNFGFDVAFGIGVPLDPSIGFYTVRMYNWFYSNVTDANGNKIRVQDSKDLKIVGCGNNSENFNFSNTNFSNTMGIPKWLCIDK